MRTSRTSAAAALLLVFALVLAPAFAVAPVLGSVTFSLHASEIDTEACGDASGFNTFKPTVKWKDFPVEFAFRNVGDFEDNLTEAFGDWDEITDRDFFSPHTGTPGSEDVLVEFAFIDKVGSILAQATVWWTLRGKAIVRAEVVFDAYDEWEAHDVSPGECGVGGSPFNVNAVASHEFGHVIGLAHFDNPVITMNTYYIGAKGQTLASGDIEGFASLYDEHTDGGGGDDGGGGNGGGGPPQCHPRRGCG